MHFTGDPLKNPKDGEKCGSALAGGVINPGAGNTFPTAGHDSPAAGDHLRVLDFDLQQWEMISIPHQTPGSSTLLPGVGN